MASKYKFNFSNISRIKLRITVLLFASLFVVFAFQNCAEVKFSVEEAASSIPGPMLKILESPSEYSLPICSLNAPLVRMEMNRDLFNFGKCKDLSTPVSDFFVDNAPQPICADGPVISPISNDAGSNGPQTEPIAPEVDTFVSCQDVTLCGEGPQNIDLEESPENVILEFQRPFGCVARIDYRAQINEKKLSAIATWGQRFEVPGCYTCQDGSTSCHCPTPIEKPTLQWAAVESDNPGFAGKPPYNIQNAQPAGVNSPFGQLGSGTTPWIALQMYDKVGYLCSPESFSAKSFLNMTLLCQPPQGGKVEDCDPQLFAIEFVDIKDKSGNKVEIESLPQGTNRNEFRIKTKTAIDATRFPLTATLLSGAQNIFNIQNSQLKMEIPPSKIYPRDVSHILRCPTLSCEIATQKVNADFTGCEDIKYNLTINKSGQGSGAILCRTQVDAPPAPCAATTFSAGTTVYLTAVPNGSSSLGLWLKNETASCGNSAECAITIEGSDKTVEFRFDEKPSNMATLGLEASYVSGYSRFWSLQTQDGKLNCNQSTTYCRYDYLKGSSITISAQITQIGAALFNGWTYTGNATLSNIQNCRSTGVNSGSCVLVLNGDTVARANIQPIKAKLNLTVVSATGSLRVTSHTTNCLTTAWTFTPTECQFDIGTRVQIIAEPTDALAFDWQGTCPGATGNECNIEVGTATTVKVGVTPRPPPAPQYNLTLQVQGAGGSLRTSDYKISDCTEAVTGQRVCSTTYSVKSETDNSLASGPVTITAVQSSTAIFSKWEDCPQVSSDNLSCTINSMSAAMVVKGIFEATLAAIDWRTVDFKVTNLINGMGNNGTSWVPTTYVPNVNNSPKADFSFVCPTKSGVSYLMTETFFAGGDPKILEQTGWISCPSGQKIEIKGVVLKYANLYGSGHYVSELKNMVLYFKADNQSAQNTLSGLKTYKFGSPSKSTKIELKWAYNSGGNTLADSKPRLKVTLPTGNFVGSDVFPYQFFCPDFSSQGLTLETAPGIQTSAGRWQQESIGLNYAWGGEQDATSIGANVCYYSAADEGKWDTFNMQGFKVTTVDSREILYDSVQSLAVPERLPSISNVSVVHTPNNRLMNVKWSLTTYHAPSRSSSYWCAVRAGNNGGVGSVECDSAVSTARTFGLQDGNNRFVYGAPSGSGFWENAQVPVYVTSISKNNSITGSPTAYSIVGDKNLTCSSSNYPGGEPTSPLTPDIDEDCRNGF